MLAVTTADRPGAILNGVKPSRIGPTAPAKSGPPHPAVLADRRRSSTDASKTLPLPALITEHPRIEPAGRVVAGRYRLRRLLGRGGMGAVWLAVDEALHRPVAIKQLVLSGLATDEERLAARARLLREARLAARVDHSGTVRVYDVAEDTGDPWIVMEALPGRTLEAALRDQGPLPVGQVTSLGLCLLDALEATHRAGIVHRDVKPSNVQLCGGLRVVLTDFGIASTAEDGSGTSTGKLVGSPAYMSPEQVHGGEFEPASDLFSLGATLYAAGEERSPFGKTPGGANLAGVTQVCRGRGEIALWQGLPGCHPHRRRHRPTGAVAARRAPRSRHRGLAGQGPGTAAGSRPGAGRASGDPATANRHGASRSAHGYGAHGRKGNVGQVGIPAARRRVAAGGDDAYHTHHRGEARSNRYVLTSDGIRVAVFSTKLHNRLLRPLLAAGHSQAHPSSDWRWRHSTVRSYPAGMPVGVGPRLGTGLSPPPPIAASG